MTIVTTIMYGFRHRCCRFVSDEPKTALIFYIAKMFSKDVTCKVTIMTVRLHIFSGFIYLRVKFICEYGLELRVTQP